MEDQILRRKAGLIKMLLMDVDGVMTDGSVWLGDDGVELKRFNIYDGQGIYLLHQASVKVGLITGRTSEALRIRAEKLEIKELHQGVLDKLGCYKEIIARHKLRDDEVAYIGDDLIDIPVLKAAGFSVGVANAVEEVKRVVDYITVKKGGDGAVREVVDIILNAQGYDLMRDFWSST